MRRGVKKIVLSTVCVLCATAVYAGISVEPTVKEVSLTPGQRAEGIYRVTNTGEVDLTITVEPVDWMRRYVRKKDSADVETWLSFAETSFKLTPGEVRDVPYVITVPPELHDEQAAQVFFAFKDETKKEAFRTRLGVIMYLSVKGNERIDAEVERVQVMPKLNDDGTYDINTHITIKNTGNVHIRPYGIMRILKNKKEIAKVEIQKGKGIYAERSDFIYAGAQNIKLTPGTYTAAIEIYCNMYNLEKKLSHKEYFTI